MLIWDCFILKKCQIPCFASNVELFIKKGQTPYFDSLSCQTYDLKFLWVTPTLSHSCINFTRVAATFFWCKTHHSTITQILSVCVQEQVLKKVLLSTAHRAAMINHIVRLWVLWPVLILYTYCHKRVITSTSIKSGRLSPSIRVT